MSKKGLNLSKQLFITFSVSLVLFVAGLAWSALTDFKADYWIALQFNKISDRYKEGVGEVQSGNLYARVHHWGNMVNRVTQGEPNGIRAKLWGGVGWYNNSVQGQTYAGAPPDNVPPLTAIDQGMIENIGGKNTGSSLILLDDPGNAVNPEFFLNHYTAKVVAPADVQHYWAGSYTTTFFEKKDNGAQSKQKKETIKRWAPNGTLNNVDYKRQPTSGSGCIGMPDPNDGCL